MIRWPGDLVSDIARRRCVVFVGSGVSANSVDGEGRRPKTWYAFLNGLLENIRPNKHIKKLLKEKDYLTACEVIKKRIGDSDFKSVLRDEYLTPGYAHATIHETIFALDSRIVATPNFDKIYETYANAQARGTIVVKNHYDEDVTSVIREPGRIVLKIHGTIDTPGRMIFTRSEYAQARSDYSYFYDILEALSLTHTFLFIGCGVNDPDMKLLLEDTFFKHKGSRQHVMLMPQGELHDAVKDIVQASMNLKIINYRAALQHQELAESLARLRELVDDKRNELSRDMNW
jgi:hypothetical protein